MVNVIWVLENIKKHSSFYTELKVSLLLASAIQWKKHNPNTKTFLYCDKLLDIGVGAALGTACGVGWFFAINAVNPTWTYYGKEEEKGKCVLGKQKFQCTYD